MKLFLSIFFVLPLFMAFTSTSSYSETNSTNLKTPVTTGYAITNLNNEHILSTPDQSHSLQNVKKTHLATPTDQEKCKNIIAQFLSDFGKVFKSLIPILAAFLAYWLGSKAFFKQKEYEMVKKRYLEEGIDIIAQQADFALSNFMHNWVRSLSVVKHFRELGPQMDSALYSSGFKIIDTKGLLVRPNHKMNMLVKDDVFYKVQQLLYSFVENANQFMINDLCQAIKNSVNGEPNFAGKEKEIIKQYTRKLVEYQKESTIYYSFVEQVENIVRELEQQNFSFENIKDFHKRNIVRKSAAELKTIFKKELKKHYDAAA